MFMNGSKFKSCLIYYFFKDCQLCRNNLKKLFTNNDFMSSSKISWLNTTSVENMNVMRNSIYNFPKLTQNFKNSYNAASMKYLKKLYLPQVRWKTEDISLETKKKDEVPGTMSSRYEIFSEQTNPIIYDIQEERLKIEEPHEEDVCDEFKGINLERGETGVFEVEELTDILRKEKAQDIFVAKIPRDFNYADYMIIVTGRSSKHMLAMAQFVRKLFKLKRKENDTIPMIEGKNSKNWIALDLDNIVLHVFSKSSRELFDLETLWCLGKEYDPQFRQKEISSDELSIDYSKLLASLAPDNAAADKG